MVFGHSFSFMKLDWYLGPKGKRPEIILCALILASLALVAFAFVSGASAGATTYKVMQSKPAFTPEQRQWVGSLLHNVAGSYLFLLIITNALWIAGSWYLFLCLKRKDKQIS